MRYFTLVITRESNFELNVPSLFGMPSRSPPFTPLHYLPPGLFHENGCITVTLSTEVLELQAVCKAFIDFMSNGDALHTSAPTSLILEVVTHDHVSPQTMGERSIIFEQVYRLLNAVVSCGSLQDLSVRIHNHRQNCGDDPALNALTEVLPELAKMSRLTKFHLELDMTLSSMSFIAVYCPIIMRTVSRAAAFTEEIAIIICVTHTPTEYLECVDQLASFEQEAEKWRLATKGVPVVDIGIYRK